MDKNIGSVDRIVRLILGVAIGLLGVIFRTWWGLVGLVLIATAAIEVCPLYLPFGLSTRKKT